jgi:tRNA A-37 threonylcarbamoyl transferase component Bud32
MTTPEDQRVGDDATEHRPAKGSDSRRATRFTPGTMLADRYRIVALLGSGGMGEVYRAEDTRLGQQVALKFLPHAVHRDPHLVERLVSEVRLGRQVSHPNVCRIYDIGEWEGNHFLAMEYVDGEDLASLLRRIGKLPAQKGFDIARDICAGIAAAHGLGIVHRDLKPANVMIDGRGQARITDFGLAAVAEELEGAHEIAGTPLYMAPEQLAGGAVTHKSDLYALGLVLYEIFTGRRLFETTDRNARQSSVAMLSGTVASDDLDPLIRRVIARCLEENPEARPSSIHAVIASLPGGDPLQAAVDAGETPSPQMVAAAGEVGDLKTSTAWTLLVLAFLGVSVTLLLLGQTSLFRLLPLPKPPDALIDSARRILESAGYPSAGGDRAYRMTSDDEFAEYMTKDRTRDLWGRLASLRPGILVFEYRQSPAAMVALNREGRVSATDPPLNVPGMTLVSVDSNGRLLSFVAVPPRQRPTAPAATVQWASFFAHAGGDFEQMRPVTPRWTPPTASDARFAWEGRFAGDPTPIRIEAASYGGKPVWFKIIGPWASAAEKETSGAGAYVTIFFALLLPAALLIAGIFARRNVLRGRGDRRTASKLALFSAVMMTIAYLFRADHVTSATEYGLMDRGLANATWYALQVWLMYLALEPYVRRQWPHMLISWTRLFAGRFRDPMLGRDLLIGLCAGPAIVTFNLLAVHAPSWFGQPRLLPVNGLVSALIESRHLVYAFAVFPVDAVWVALFVLFLFLLMFAVFRRRWVAILLVGLVMAMGFSGVSDGPVYQLTAGLACGVLFMFVLLRFGLLATVVTLFFSNLLRAVHFSFDVEPSYFGRSLFFIVFFVAAATYGFWSALGEKKAFGMPVLEQA